LAELLRLLRLTAMAKPSELVVSIAEVGRKLGPQRVLQLSEFVRDLPQGADPAMRFVLVQRFANVEQRAAVQELMKAWDRNENVPSSALALALESVGTVASYLSEGARADLVWTGPHIGSSHFRDTEQALLELVGIAQERLTLCTFAAYRIQSVANALRAALERGVNVELIAETPEVSSGRTEFDPFEAFAKDLLSRITVYVWPRDQRPTDVKGRFGSLHAKFVLADAAALFLTSANLTEYALRLNLELGVLIRGGELPRKLRNHLDFLIDQGHLVTPKA
jgi:phosphatidylserine/phosphatidylglycerophosphate/cardiolipin synthase-like enzyme